MKGFLKQLSVNEMESEVTQIKPKKLNWYYGPAFILFWFILFIAVVVPVFFNLPNGLQIAEEHKYPGEFIGERAQSILLAFDRIGPKVVGSFANENITVQLLLDEIAKIRNVMHNDLFDMEVDIQQVSGAYMHWTMINMYQGLQNVVVKFQTKTATSENYLLINSHFDTKTGCPGSGDDGAMVVVMLEVLRVLATQRQTYEHPIIFLFNGAEENPLQASHGFITQHKWAKNCKALINLDSAGSGHKEILFQSGPNHPWLMNYYNKHAKVPYATTVAEELFERELIPSDTDFRIFKNFGGVPGLDFAHTYNGYVYHTAFDNYNVIPRGTLQTTGDNILALTKAFANAPELYDTSKYAEGHTVFYDFLNLFLVYYTETEGKIMNTCISVITLILVGISIWRMAVTCFMKITNVLQIFAIVFVLHVIGFVLAIGIPILLAVIYDADDRSLTWLTNKWLVIGVYICPSLFGLCAPTLLYLSYTKHDKLTRPFLLQLILHSHSVILAIICIVITFIGVRSSYLCMIALFFYACSLLINLITNLHIKNYYWCIVLIISQIMPFLYFSYLIHALLCTLIPMMGRYGTTTNPDLYIAGLCALGVVLAMGFVIPLMNIFRKPKLLLLSLVAITFIFCMMTLTHLGFPYRPKTNVGRVNFMQVRRVFYEYDGAVSRNESGYYIDFQDRRMPKSIESDVDLSNLESNSDDCDEYMVCGLPIFNHRGYKVRKENYWLPREEPVALAYTPTLTLISRSIYPSTMSMRFEYELKGPPHMSIFIETKDNVDITDWSFIHDMLDDPVKYPQPHHIYLTYGNDSSPIRFYIDVKKTDQNYEEPLFELGIGAHFVSGEHERDEYSKDFIKQFPDYIFVMEWPSSYERYIF